MSWQPPSAEPPQDPSTSQPPGPEVPEPDADTARVPLESGPPTAA